MQDRPFKAGSDGGLDEVKAEPRSPGGWLVGGAGSYGVSGQRLGLSRDLESASSF